jgi:cation diffusion facilitator CzcD-associated flavoprotein CzcO
MRVICVGAGVSGLYLAYKLRKHFTDYILDIYEKNADIGGTWFENRYPGCKRPPSAINIPVPYKVLSNRIIF